MPINQIKARQILDSRGNPTIEADVILDQGIYGRASVPSGASTGSHEAHELRDNDPSQFGGKSVRCAVANVHDIIAPSLKDHDVSDQAGLDQIMRDLDGTPNKSKLGANAILAVSLAAAHAAAAANRQSLFTWLHKLSGTNRAPSMPLPLMNIINGGQHAAGSTDIQEFMIIPVSAKTFSQAIQMGTEVFHALAAVLTRAGYSTTVGDEGGYAPPVKHGHQEALDLIREAISQTPYQLGQDICLALDVAASELYQNGRYHLATENLTLDTSQMIDWLINLTRNYPLISIEDGLAESDWAGWQELTKQVGDKIQLVGDDLLVTNVAFLNRALKEQAGNAILIKPNQIGTLTETIEAVQLAHHHDWQSIISHRSGETEDTTIAHLAVGLATGQIKTGSLSRTDRVAKYNELLRIEEELGSQARLASFPRH